MPDLLPLKRSHSPRYFLGRFQEILPPLRISRRMRRRWGVKCPSFMKSAKCGLGCSGSAALCRAGKAQQIFRVGDRAEGRVVRRASGLLDDNGAGKSTLIKTLSGVYTPDEGENLVNGRRSFMSPRHARQRHLPRSIRTWCWCR